MDSHSKKNIEIRQEREDKITAYYQNPKLCLQCQKPIDYEKRVNNFCNSSCGASYTNLKRPPRSEESKQNTLYQNIILKMIF